MPIQFDLTKDIADIWDIIRAFGAANNPNNTLPYSVYRERIAAQEKMDMDFDEDDCVWLWPEPKTPRVIVEVQMFAPENEVHVVRDDQERKIVVTGDVPRSYKLFHELINARKESIEHQAFMAAIYGAFVTEAKFMPKEEPHG